MKDRMIRICRVRASAPLLCGNPSAFLNAAIIRLSGPRTTTEEIRACKKLIAGKSWKRVGVCSSAWHLRRVEKICRQEGVDMIPVPADFLSTRLPWSPMYAVPQARGFQNVQKALWEFLGAFTGG
jgi:uncharacterized SAM-binding protein YcdF (DUF218 family)